jgi:hypothetical protein
MYVDDTSQDLTEKSVESIESKMCEDLQRSIVWITENKVSINLSKLQCMLVGSAQKLSSVGN